MPGTIAPGSIVGTVGERVVGIPAETAVGEATASAASASASTSAASASASADSFVSG